jgi:hypothetical protein
MTRPLRQRHRQIVIVLTVLISVLFAWGILGRREVPVMRKGDATAVVGQEGAQ